MARANGETSKTQPGLRRTGSTHWHFDRHLACCFAWPKGAIATEPEKQQAERKAIKESADTAAVAQKAAEAQAASLREDQERQSAAQKAAAERYAGQQREQNEIERLAELEAQKRVAYRQFFVSEVYDESVPVVVWASGRLPPTHVQAAIEAAVINGHGGYYKATAAARPAFWTTARPADVLNGDYSGLARVVYPSGISKIVFIRFDGEDCDCGQTVYRVSTATFDVRRNTVTPSNQRRFIRTIVKPISPTS